MPTVSMGNQNTLFIVKEHGINWREEKENEYLASKNGNG
jgi:hypothetical protein